MKIFAGPLRTGYLAILTALLLPVLGIGIASADMSVGDTIMLKVPDLSEFPNPVETHQFTCRAVTEHAYWLVQDSCSVDGSGLGVLDTNVWNNLITQGELDTLTADFEGNGVNVYGTVEEYLGSIPDTDGDPRVYIALATIRDVYQNQPTDRNAMAYVNPADFDTTQTFNDLDIFYINVHTYTNNSAVLAIAKDLRQFYIPNGLGMLVRTALRPDEGQWIIRGLGAVSQYMAYGFTESAIVGLGNYADIELFAKASNYDLTFYESGGHANDYSTTRGQEMLWFMYLAQRQGDTVLENIAQSDTTEMLNIARAIDSSVHDTTAIQTNVVPIYYDWLVCNITNDIRDDMNGGIYRYDIFSDTNYSFTHIGQIAAFEGRFDDGDYPLDVWIPGEGLEAPIWAAQYDEFKGDYSGNSTVYFNGAYADAGGSGMNIDGKWSGRIISLDTDTGGDPVDIVSVEDISLNDLYNGSIELAGENAYLFLTNNNPDGAGGLSYVLSQDAEAPEVLISAFQNSINDQYLTLYTSLYDSIPEGFDWYGPIFTASTADSSSLLSMSSFYGTIWDNRFSAWETGDYTLTVAGYDSSGHSVSNTRDISVGFVSSGKMTLDVEGIQLDVNAGSAAPGTMVSLCETDLINPSTGEARTAESITGVLSGPVSVPNVTSTLSFPAESSVGAVYRHTASGWEKLESYYQNGRMYALVNDGGTYVYGESPGVSSPEIPADFSFGGVYPNPFSAEAAIRFTLPSSGRVSVTIYDMSGRVVRTLTDTEMSAAEHTLMWDGLDQQGSSVGAGVYFCRLQACGETVTQKMLRIE